jgi:phosphatidylglycerophosphate synthase
LGIFKPELFRAIIIALIVLGLLSDIFDGIIARRLNISTEKLRRMDSTVDQFFWLCIVVSAYIVSPVFFKDNLVAILILLALEATCYVISFLKFKKEVATHAIASKIWTLFLFATLIQVIATGNSVLLFYVCFYLGVISRLEIIFILLILKDWTNDIPTVYHAVLIKKGKPIKRHKLFNG